MPLAPIFKDVRREIIQFFNNSVIFTPGDGTTISLWEHDWGFGILRHILPAIYSHTLNPEITLKGFILCQEANLSFRPNLTEEELTELQLINQWISTMELHQTRKDNI